MVGVKELRQDKGWSQERLADLSGLSLRTVQRIEASNTAGYRSLQALASAFEIDDSALELEMSMDKSSNEWKKRPIWVRAIFYGSSRIQMNIHQYTLLERIAVVAGMVFVVIGLYGTNGTFAPESASVPMLLFASLLFFSAYLTSLFIRIGDRYSVWRWVDAENKDR